MIWASMAGALAGLGRVLRPLVRAIAVILKWLVMIFTLFAWVTVIGDYRDSKKRNDRDRH